MIKTCSDERMTYMKKLVMLVTVVLTVAMAAVCFAAGDGCLLYTSDAADD